MAFQKFRMNAASAVSQVWRQIVSQKRLATSMDGTGGSSVRGLISFRRTSVRHKMARLRLRYPHSYIRSRCRHEISSRLDYSAYWFKEKMLLCGQKSSVGFERHDHVALAKNFANGLPGIADYGKRPDALGRNPSPAHRE